MTTPVSKNLRNRGQARSKSKGKGFLPLTEYKRKQKAEIDALRKAAGG